MKIKNFSRLFEPDKASLTWNWSRKVNLFFCRKERKWKSISPISPEAFSCNRPPVEDHTRHEIDIVLVFFHPSSHCCQLFLFSISSVNWNSAPSVKKSDTNCKQENKRHMWIQYKNTRNWLAFLECSWRKKRERRIRNCVRSPNLSSFSPPEFPIPPSKPKPSRYTFNVARKMFPS